MICGIDEAGRGPVIGPLVMAGIIVPEDEFDKLTKMGIKDSKLLSKDIREKLYDQLLHYRHYVSVTSPPEIDNYVTHHSLNILEAHKTAEILNTLKPKKAIIDLPDKNPKRYGNIIRSRLDSEIELVLEHKADLNYEIVGAASILAKVTRDRLIDQISKEIGIEIGSGYPADPTTKKFLEKNFDDSKIQKHIRKTWSTWTRLISAKKQTSLGEF